MAKGWNDKRPMSPHLSIWKWHPAMLSSILHRAAVIILFIALFKICLWLAIFAFGDGAAAFDAVKGLIYSTFGAICFFIFSATLIYHVLIDLRHIVWDGGRGLGANTANVWSYIILFFAAVGGSVLTSILIRSVGGLS